MLQPVDVGERSLSSYRGIAPEAILAEVREQVRQHFLLPRLVLDDLLLLGDLLNGTGKGTNS